MSGGVGMKDNTGRPLVSTDTLLNCIAMESSRASEVLLALKARNLPLDSVTLAAMGTVLRHLCCSLELELNDIMTGEE